MPRFSRYLRTILCALSLLLCVGVCVMRIRAGTQIEELSWHYNRWLPDKSAAATHVALTFDKRRIQLSIGNGRMGPPTGWLVAGYYINADNSGGKPQWSHHRADYDPFMEWIWSNGTDRYQNYSGWGPVRWIIGRRAPPKDSDHHWGFDLHVSYWLVIVVLSVPPAAWAVRFWRARRKRVLGCCANCNYDLRATPNKCPECGMDVPGA
jgi:hypothetical protein